MNRSEAEVRDAYSDLLEAEQPGLLRLAQILDAGYGMHAAPTSIREGPFAVSNYLGAQSSPKGTRISLRSTLRWAWRLRAVAVVALAVLVVGVSFAVSNITNLGKPVDILSTASYFPLSGFHRVHLAELRQGGKPELLFLGAQGAHYDAINAERWPLVKALDQFGRLTGVRAIQPVCTALHGGGLDGQEYCGVATFDLAHARYSSRYIAFVSKDLITEQVEGQSVVFHAFQKMTPLERRVFNRFARPQGRVMCGRMAHGHYVTYPCTSYVDTVEATINTNTGRGLPLIAIGDYVQTASQVLTPSDLARTIALTSPPGRIVYASEELGLPFQTIQQALIHQKDPPTTRLVETVNSEANIITALICHADGKRPKSVCTRPVIKSILKYGK